MEASISLFPAPPTVGVDEADSYVELVGMNGLQVIKRTASCRLEVALQLADSEKFVI